MVPTPEIIQASLNRTLRGLTPLHQARITSRYERLLPLLRLLLRPRDIYERNRAWPGVRPIGKEATTYLSPSESWRARDVIVAYAIQSQADPNELWDLFYAYCRYGPIGLVDALDADESIWVPEALQACAQFHRLAKHPRSDAGSYIRELLAEYATALQVDTLPDFLARYVFVAERRLTNWFVGEHAKTAHLVKTTRRLNLDQDYPHQCWFMKSSQFPFTCILSERHPTAVQPWLLWCWDHHTGETQGVVITPYQPTIHDVLRCYRWSIWHYEAPWWSSRGAPERLILPNQSTPLESTTKLAFVYTHCQCVPSNKTDAANVLDASEDTPLWYGLPGDFTEWLAYIGDGFINARRRPTTVAELRTRLLDYFQELTEQMATRSTPSFLSSQGVSLPWSQDAAAVLLLPSAGVHVLNGQEVYVFGVPYRRSSPSQRTSTSADIRFDPDDARLVYLVHNSASIEVAHARDFEHPAAWIELVDDPSLILVQH